jgi:hypothetical protein
MKRISNVFLIENVFIYLFFLWIHKCDSSTFKEISSQTIILMSFRTSFYVLYSILFVCEQGKGENKLNTQYPTVLHTNYVFKNNQVCYFFWFLFPTIWIWELEWKRGRPNKCSSRIYNSISFFFFCVMSGSSLFWPQCIILIQNFESLKWQMFVLFEDVSRPSW